MPHCNCADTQEPMKKVFCLGVWDLFHIGHLSVLFEASSLGELTVGVVVDEAVREKKGPLRPIIPFWQRRMIVENIKGVAGTIATLFTIPENVLTDYDFIVIGGDQDHITNLAAIPPAKLIKLERPADGNSTSLIVKRIKES